MVRSFGIGGYRSFPEELQVLPRIDRVNVLAGSNNSGKSNVLRFISRHYAHVFTGCRIGTPVAFDDLDQHVGPRSGAFNFALGVEVEGEFHQALRKDQRLVGQLRQNTASVVDRLFSHPVLVDSNGLLWIRFRGEAKSAPLVLADIEALAADPWLSRSSWERICTAFRPAGTSGGSLEDWITEVLKHLTPQEAAPQIHEIPTFRSIGGAGTEPTGFAGVGIIEQLARLQNPELGNTKAKAQFDRIQSFLREVTGDQTMTLEIPHDRTAIHVDHQGRTLPIESLGTGIHQVVILAAAATVVGDDVLCIEEPETNLHPVLQRKLLRYLVEKTSGQFFISTHSASLLDPDLASIFHVSHDGDGSRITLASSTSQQFSIVRDLGYNASDILQANCIVWVEGPTDRIYLKHWMSDFDPTLTEGIHYSLMFYGGRLLSHLSADDEEVDEFIALRPLNRHVAIVIDSDRRAAKQALNATKARVIKEIEQCGGFVWVTEGREIENYLSRDSLVRCFEELVEAKPAPVQQYHSALRYYKSSGEVAEYGDKVKLAREVVKSPADLSRLDLRDRVAELVAFIREANDLLPLSD